MKNLQKICCTFIAFSQNARRTKTQVTEGLTNKNLGEGKKINEQTNKQWTLLNSMKKEC